MCMYPIVYVGQNNCINNDKRKKEKEKEKRIVVNKLKQY